MNFIEQALKDLTNGEAFVQAMADIYEYPEVRETLKDYPLWIRNIIAVIDYDAELTMDGLDAKSYRDTIAALTDMGLAVEAEALMPLEGNTSQEVLDSCYEKIALNNNYEDFWNKIYSYADENMKH